MRQTRRGFAIACWYAGLLMVWLTIAPAAASSSTTLTILLTTSPRVPAEARQMLVREASRIWADADVRLAWPQTVDGSTSASSTLRVLVVDRPGTPGIMDDVVLGELVRTESHRAIALVSLTRAERVAAGSDRPWMSTNERLGLILGRAVAHEIGHYLLQGRPHGPDGLMRAQFRAGELADPRSSAFAIDQDTRAWLRSRVAVPTAIPSGVLDDQE